MPQEMSKEEMIQKVLEWWENNCQDPDPRGPIPSGNESDNDNWYYDYTKRKWVRL